MKVTRPLPTLVDHASDYARLLQLLRPPHNACFRDVNIYIFIRAVQMLLTIHSFYCLLGFYKSHLPNMCANHSVQKIMY